MNGGSGKTNKGKERFAGTVDSRLREFQECFGKLSAERRFYCIIRAWMHGERPNETPHGKFADWLLDDRDAEIKDIAMGHVFYDMFRKDGCNECRYKK